MTDHPVRKLIVTGQRELSQLANGSVLYEVFCTDEHGERIDLPFRAFMELSQGKVEEYEVRPYDHEEYGRTFTLIPKNRESRTKKLTVQVKALEDRINEFENSLEVEVKRIVGEEMERINKFGDKAPW